MTWQWRQAVANLSAAEAANRKAQARFGLAMEAVRAFTTGASEDVILKEKALEGLRKKLLGQSRRFYERLTDVAGGGDRPGVAVGAGRGALSTRARCTARWTHRRRRSRRSARRWRCGESLVREQPGEPTARRDLGRSRLALAGLLGSPSLQQIAEARAELARARDVLEPLRASTPGDGGARRCWPSASRSTASSGERSTAATEEGRGGAGASDGDLRGTDPRRPALYPVRPRRTARRNTAVGWPRRWSGRHTPGSIDGEVEARRGRLGTAVAGLLEDLTAGPFADRRRLAKPRPRIFDERRVVRVSRSSGGADSHGPNGAWRSAGGSSRRTPIGGHRDRAGRWPSRPPLRISMARGALGQKRCRSSGP